MKSPRNRDATGGGLLGAGMAFLVIAISGQPLLLGVAMALIATGIALLAKAGEAGCRP